MGAGAVIALLLYISQYGFQLKGRVIQQGSAAIGHLIAARDSIEQLDVQSAQNQLSLAQSEFSKASDTLNILGPQLTRLLSHIPGLASLRAGQDLLEAGRLLSEAGNALSEAMQALSQSGGLIDAQATDRTSMGDVLLPMEAAFDRAAQSVADAQRLLDGVDSESVPAEYRAQYEEVVARIPELRELVDRATQGVQFLTWFTGTEAPRRYIVLFANNSELRPTGGFPGSYGVLTFERGRLKDFKADDIYNPDGQIRALVVPPEQLQHITPDWGMRDAAWWADFPTSAEKVMEFWRLGGGTAVDGVIAVQPDVLADILRVIGPIKPDGYDITLSADTVLPELQREVEYGIDKERGAPKQIIADLAPVIVQRMAALKPQQWAMLLQSFRARLATRAIQLYVTDAERQTFIVGQQWDGRILDAPGDYLHVNVANVKGAKADAVTDMTMKLETWAEKGTMVHRLTLTRQHSGGQSEYGFYNKPNHSWIRVLVPEGSVLRGVSGNDRPSHAPLMTYGADAQRDADLDALEQTYETGNIWGATVFEESGKTGFGFWHSLEPGETRTVQLEYEIPAAAAASDYRLLVQRQAGLRISDFEFSLRRDRGVAVQSSEPVLTEWPDSWRLHSSVEQDLDISIQLR
jgi:hypothetical protein